jgi:hypothetical protein
VKKQTKENAGILRFAQNDKLKLTTTEILAAPE